MLFFCVYLLIGIFAGSLSGLLGIGGGIVVVPVLFLWFQYIHLFPHDMAMHLAVGTSLATMIGTSWSSARAYQKHGCVVWSYVWRFIPGLCFGMILGSVIANRMSGHTLSHAFAIFLWIIAIHLILSNNTQKRSSPIHEFPPSSASGEHSVPATSWLKKRLNLYLYPFHRKILNFRYRFLPYLKRKNDVTKKTIPSTRMGIFIFVGILIGTLSTLFGIGGGLLIVPFFLFLGLSMNEASGTSALCGVPISLLGAIILTISGWHATQMPPTPWGTLGYIYWPGAITISLSSILFAKLGVNYAIKILPMTRKIILSIILMLCSFNMLFF